MPRTPMSIDVVKKEMGLLEGVPPSNKPPRHKRAMSIDEVRKQIPSLEYAEPEGHSAVRRDPADPTGKRKVHRATSIEDAKVAVGVDKVRSTLASPTPPPPVKRTAAPPPPPPPPAHREARPVAKKKKHS